MNTNMIFREVHWSECPVAGDCYRVKVMYSNVLNDMLNAVS